MFDIRRKTIFEIIIFLEIIIFSGILYWGYSNIGDESQRITNFGSTIASLAIVLLTTSLVYSNFSQHPEIAFIGFLIEPMSKEHEPVAKSEYMENVAGSKQVRNDKYSKRYFGLEKIVECESPPSFLNLRNDITNLGLSKGNIHEIRYYMTYPKQKQPYIAPNRFSLSNQERKTIRIKFPTSKMEDWGENLKEGILIFKFEGIGATNKLKKEIWISVSEDRKTINWSESKIIIYSYHVKNRVCNFFRI